VLDARLAPLGDVSRLEALSKCLIDVGVGQVQAVVEAQVIPGPETAVIPMPYLIERALQIACRRDTR